MQNFGTRPTSVYSSSLSYASTPNPPAFLISVPTFSSASSRSSSSSSGLSSGSRRSVLIRDFGIDTLLVPSHRRPKFDVNLQVCDLSNVPLVSGQAYIKWYIEGSTRADCRGRTNRKPIKDHKVSWNYSHHMPDLRFTIGRDNMLQDQFLVLEVHQEYSGARERIQLGTVKVCLAGYAGLEKETRRYLMQDSKINSTMKIGIEMRQVGGDTYFDTPQLKRPQVFSGIAGITGEQRDLDDTRNLTTLNSKSREAGAAQDMYRRTLAASWQLQAGELNADECIEDIFAGGDGWTSGSNGGQKPKFVRLFDRSRKDGSDSDSLSQLSAGIATPTISTVGEKATPSLLAPGPIKDGKKKGYALSVMTRRSKTALDPGRRPKEIDEIEARDDLVSWRMPGPTISRR